MLNVLNAHSVKMAELAWAKENGGHTWPLMQKAAQSFVRQFLGSISQSRVLVVVGVGNNGGDGYLIAQLLTEAGLKVCLWAPLGLPSSSIDAEMARKSYVESGGAIHNERPKERFDVIVDALFGSGLNRALTDTAKDVIRWMNDCSLPIYAVDVPSGLDSNSGLPMPCAVSAGATHSFIALKPGMLTGEGPHLCGCITLDSLAVDSTSNWSFNNRIQLPRRSGNTHKAKHGNVRVVGGKKNMAGAAVIAGCAALNAGAGRVFLHCDSRYFPAAISLAPEMICAEELHLFKAVRDVYVIGPGLGSDESSAQIIEQAIEHVEQTGVLDADALRWLAKNQRTALNWVLTPHESEAAGLLNCAVSKVQEDRVGAVVALAKKFETVVVLKGAGTLIAYGEKVVFCDIGSPAMATPGQGDCLAGIIGALLAQGLAPAQAAVSAVNWHARLGYRLSELQRVVLATDIIQQLKLQIPEEWM